MLKIEKVDHIAVIASDLTASLAFYCDVLGFTVLSEHYRAERDSYKVDLALNGEYLLELFTFPASPVRVSQPEACGLRHLAFAVQDLAAWETHLKQCGVRCDSIRTDEFTGKSFFFCFDPDNLPVEFYAR
ncbi:VOC family protein [Morganella morganii]|uniref:VOC family protein n=1 Tax=Morganella morganii TaxID=582 RepID=UPI0029D1BC45|nr:VOC family protein [Morganella morganii]EMD0828459.1 VOC family protein [Morganella morganii]HEI8570261.1 VOC family protein [Morganella morganii]